MVRTVVFFPGDVDTKCSVHFPVLRELYPETMGVVDRLRQIVVGMVSVKVIRFTLLFTTRHRDTVAVEIGST